MLKRTISLLVVLTMIVSCLSGMAFADAKYTAETTPDGWVKVTQDGGPILGYSPDSGVTILEVDGYAFKDLNKNGELDLYEDWRESYDDRAADLAARLSKEQCAGLLEYPAAHQIMDDGSDSGSDFSGTFSQDIKDGARSILNFATTFPYKTQATWSNNMQAVAEAEEFGIPVNIAANPTQFNMWTGDNLALGATFNVDLVKQVSEELGKQYRAIGITTLLGPQIDLSTEPRWNRIGGTFGEDPQLSADMADAMISGLQSTYDEDGNDLGWGSESVIAMMKHFPGDGAGESGREGHIGAAGEYCVYPGDGFETALIPFVDGGLNLESSTEEAGAVMTSFSIAYDEDELYGELVGSAFSEYKLNILRNDYNYDGVICTDWIYTPYGKLEEGVGDLSKEEQLAKALLAGVDQFGGTTTLEEWMSVFNIIAEDLGEDAALARFQESARRILKSFFKAQLFENPYVDTASARATIENETAYALAEQVQQESIVMLKNANGRVSSAANSEEKLTVYIPMVFTEAVQGYMGVTPASWSFPMDRKTADHYFNVITDIVGEPTGEADAEGNPTYTENDIIRASAEELAKCDMAIVLVQNPQTGAGYDSETDTFYPISLQYEEYTADSEGVRSESIAGQTIKTQVQTPYGVTTQVSKKNNSYYGETSRISNTADLHTILYAAENMPEDATVAVCITTDAPIVVSEFEENVDIILLGFSGEHEYFLKALVGEFEPSGLLPFQMPASMEDVELQLEDVPRDVTCYVDSEGNTYDFAYGLNWSGVINDERTETYGAEARLSLNDNRLSD